MSEPSLEQLRATLLKRRTFDDAVYRGVASAVDTITAAQAACAALSTAVQHEAQAQGVALRPAAAEAIQAVIDSLAVAGGNLSLAFAELMQRE